MAAAPTADELAPLLAPDSAALDEEIPDEYADENGAFMAAAKRAVGDQTKASALKDAITECLREHGLISAVEDDDEPTSELAVGEGFPDL